MAAMMQVYVVIPDNDRPKSVYRITVRTTPVSHAYLAGPKRDCAMLPPAVGHHVTPRRLSSAASRASAAALAV